VLDVFSSNTADYLKRHLNLSNGVFRSVTTCFLFKRTDVSEERTVRIFRAEEWISPAIKHELDYKASLPRRQFCTAERTSDLAFIAFCRLQASDLKHPCPVTRTSVLPQTIRTTQPWIVCVCSSAYIHSIDRYIKCRLQMRRLWKVLSSRMWCRIVWYTVKTG